MEIKEIMERIDEYAEATGLSTSTICERATGNSRLYGRLHRRIKSQESIAEKFAVFFEKNPLPNEATQ